MSSACSASSSPRQYGGSGADFTTLCVAIEELGRADQSIGITLEAGVGLGINPILAYGTDAAEGAAARPGRRPGAGRFGLTQPEAGSDAGATRTRAELADGQWTINGAKGFITTAPSTTWLVTSATITGPSTSTTPATAPPPAPPARQPTCSTSPTANACPCPQLHTLMADLHDYCRATANWSAAAMNQTSPIPVLDATAASAISALPLGSRRRPCRHPRRMPR